MPFAHDDYKSYVAAATTAAGTPLARVAEAAGMHRQYLTQVLRYKAHLSDEQAHLVGTFLGLRGDALAYFLLLVQEAKTTHPATRRYFAARRADLREAHEKLSAKLAKDTKVLRTAGRDRDYTAFFLDVTLQICHAHFFIPAFQKDPKLLGDKLRLTASELDDALRALTEMGLVERAGTRVKSLVPFLHLERDSPLSRQNHRNWRIYAAHIPLGNREQDFIFSCTVTSDRKARKALVEKLKAVIAAFHQSLGDTGDDEAFQVNVDVFGL